ncbi:hypothetical protein B0H16DRAFT_1731054 [Mycena metata]|uniref:Uncharacterized protein n=1 Tax=Mycena metata TaxID=1033252 RepID=A0AAD7I7Z7_9AGAR|nr:hypothetical protein B0H16DRAFT_1731054 [Mycena metata]
MSEAALVLWLLSPVLDNTLRYTILSLSLALLVAYLVRYYTPWHMVLRLEITIKTLRNTLNHAKAKCPMDLQLTKLTEMGCQLTQVEVSVSGIRGQLLDIGSLSTWKKYFQGLRGIFKTITERVKDLQTSVLRIVEGEHERQLRLRVEEECGIFNALMGHVEDVGLVRRRRPSIPVYTHYVDYTIVPGPLQIPIAELTVAVFALAAVEL